MMEKKTLAAVLGLVLLLPAGSPAQDKETVYRNVSSAVLEDILRDLEVRYKKGSKKDREYFDFEVLEEGLDQIRAISEVLDYTQDTGQDRSVLSMTIIAAGLAEALQVVHDRLAKHVQE